MIIKSHGMTGYKGAVGINRVTNRPFLVMVGLLIPEGVDIVVPKTEPDRIVFCRSERAIVKAMVPYHDGFFLGMEDPIDWDHTATSLFEWSLILNVDPAYIFPQSFLEGSLSTVYKVGEEVIADTLDPSENVYCAPGIHFFRSIRDTERYLHVGWWPSSVIDGIRQRSKRH